MATSTTTVTGRIFDANGIALANKYIKFRLKSVGVDDDVSPEETFPRGTVEAQSDASGDFSVNLWVNGDSDVECLYEVKFPDGETIDVIVPSSASGGTIDLATLISENQPDGSAQQSSVLALAKAYTDTLANNPVANASFTALNWRSGLNVENGADVTDTENVTAAGALMDSEVSSLSGIKTLTVPDSTTISVFGASLVDDADAVTARATLGLSDALSSLPISNTIFVAKNGDDGTGAVGRLDLPFLTVNAAEDVAVSGDTILVFPGDYSAEDLLNGVDGVTYQGLDGAILPGFEVVTAITIKGSGLCHSIRCSNASAVIDMPDMDTVSLLDVNNGDVTVNSVGTDIDCSGGTTLCSGFGSEALCSGGTLTIDGAIVEATLPILARSTGNITIRNSRIEATDEDDFVVALGNAWSGSMNVVNSDLVATNAGTNGSTAGIAYSPGVTGNVQLKDCTIITAQNGTGVAKSIDAPSAQTVYIQGSLNQTHHTDTFVTYEGGLSHTNTNFTA